MSLFKYLKKEHFESLIKVGSLKVGTLSGYRKPENGSMVTDPMEGKTNFTGKYNSFSAKDADCTPFSHIFNIGEGAGFTDIKFEDVKLVDPDLFAFCLAKDYSESVHKLWLKEEGYDGTYEVIAPNHFFRRITSRLNEQLPVKFLGVFRMHYYNEIKGLDLYNYRAHMPSFMLKDEDKFSEQIEYKAIWQPIEKVAIEPLIVKDPRFKNYVRHHKNIV